MGEYKDSAAEKARECAEKATECNEKAREVQDSTAQVWPRRRGRGNVRIIILL